jgi:hypothetical protein
MPKQELFFEQQIGDKRVEVLKSYDQSYAHEVFNRMDEEARKHLWDALKPEENYDPEDLPKLNDPDDVNDEAGSFLWDELVEQALEDARASPRVTSFFIVNETIGRSREDLFVSPDWPTAEAFAKNRLGNQS